jgi:methanethiol S-methyltransferase
MLFGSLFIITGLHLIVKGWERIYFGNDTLSTEGIYWFMRLPQNTGIFLVMFGQLSLPFSL